MSSTFSCIPHHPLACESSSRVVVSVLTRVGTQCSDILFGFCFPHALAPHYPFPLHLPSGDTTLKTVRSPCTFSTIFSTYTAAWSVVCYQFMACRHSCPSPPLALGCLRNFWLSFLLAYTRITPYTPMVRDAISVLSHTFHAPYRPLYSFFLPLHSKPPVQYFSSRHFPNSVAKRLGGMWV